MSLQSLSSGFSLIGPRPYVSPPGITSVLIDAANEAAILIGRIVTSDGGQHTLDTSGQSAIMWQTAGVTFANAGTSVSVGIAPVDTATGPPARASNAANVISFDVKAVLPGNGGGITANAWQTSVPTTGTKTINNGDLVAIAVQMTARGGAADSITVSALNYGPTINRPVLTGFTGGSYARQTSLPNALIRFSDGAYGWIDGGDIFSTITSRNYNSGSVTKEFGQLYQMPFPMKVWGLYCPTIINTNADADLILYSDPLGGSPVAEKTASIDGNVLGATSGWVYEPFASPYSVAANQPIAAILKPTTATNVTLYAKTLNNAAHRVADPWGTNGYGISRASGAFADANSSLDHYYIGLIVSAYDGGGGRSVQINNDSIVGS